MSLSEPEELSKEDLEQHILDFLKGGITTQAIITSTLCAKYGVGEKRVRDAIQRLKESNLINTAPNFKDMRTVHVSGLKNGI